MYVYTLIQNVISGKIGFRVSKMLVVSRISEKSLTEINITGSLIFIL